MAPERNPWYRELGTLFWLQGKLTLSAFRSRRTRHTAAAVRLILSVVQLVFSVPFILGTGVAVGVGIAFVTPEAAFELAVFINTIVALVWMLAPGAYSSQILERFEMSRLFPHPIRPQTIVVGSTAISLLTMTGVWTVPLLLGEIVGLAWHAPLALPLIVLGALPLFLFMLLMMRVVEDLFDLIADDRRLRAVMLSLISIPFMLLGFAQFGLRFLTDDFSRVPAFLRGVIDVERLAQATNFSEFVTALRPSQWLLWLPPGWITAGMAYPVTGMWGRSLLFLALGFLTIAGLLALHAFATLRLMRGAALTVGTSRVRSGRRLALPFPAPLRALIEKDLHHLWRSPLPRRMIFGVVIMTAMMVLPFTRVSTSPLSEETGRGTAVGMTLMVVAIAGMSLNLAFTANYFGAIDREGLGSLMVTAVDRRLILVSANLTTLLMALVAYALPAVATAVLFGTWRTLPLLLFVMVAIQVSSTPAFTLASILAPYRARVEMRRQRERGNMWGLLAWAFASAPVALMVLLPFFLFPALLWATVPLSALYAMGVYVLTLQPLARLLQRREGAILEAITSD